LEWLGNVNGGPESIQATAIGETDFGSAFNGAIVKLRDSGSKVTSVISYYGSDELTNVGVYVLEDSPVKAAKDFIGRSIGVNTLGAQYEFQITEWLAQEGLTEEEIAQVELKVIPPANSEQVLRQGQVDGVILSTIALEVARERGGIRELFNDLDVFGPASNGSLVFRDDYIKENPEVVEEFVTGVARAIRWTQLEDPEEVKQAYTEILSTRDRGEDTNLVQYYRSLGISTPGGVITESEYSTWIEQLKRGNGLKNTDLKAQDVYTNEFNPYANGTYESDADADGNPID
jgi:ABC-type nitrate/sulfonate/bicarbonate transport system substrate-binding protein